MSEVELTKEGVPHAVHVHILHRHIPSALAILMLIGISLGSALTAYIYTTEVSNVQELNVKNSHGNQNPFTYGSWPALENANFYNDVKSDLISQKVSFIDANLSDMVLRLYEDGVSKKEVPILSKGKEGSWWETPAGLYKVSTKEKNHFSSFGNVYMPWSMQFQGNFFIHGWPYYPDGTDVAAGFSGGCIRLDSDDAEEIFKLSNKKMPILVYKESLVADPDPVAYQPKKILKGNADYLVADLKNNFVFAESGADDLNSVASITKLMTALIAVEYINVEKEITINPGMIATTSIPRLQVGERSTILDLLSVLLMESSNEAALAVPSPLGMNSFINLMNVKAGSIGMNNTKFADTSGVLSGNKSTAEDLFMLSKYLYFNRSFVLHMSIGEENRAAYGRSKYGNLSNLNSIPGIKSLVGGKTGISSRAGDSMVAVVQTKLSGEERPIVFIVLGSDDAKGDIALLYRHITSNFDISIN